MIPFVVVPKKNPITQDVKYYPQIAPMEHLDLLNATQAISERCTVTEHDVKAVLSAMQMAIVKHITNGESVRFGDLGSFRLTIKGKPAETKDKVNTSYIDRLRVRYTMSSRLAQIFNSNISQLDFEKIEKK